MYGTLKQMKYKSTLINQSTILQAETKTNSNYKHQL